MHPEIKTAINQSPEGFPDLSEIAQHNAERLIMYITGKGMFDLSMLNTTFSGGLSIYLMMEQWQFYMHSTNEGRILYILWKGMHQYDCGYDICEVYLPKLIFYLNIMKFSNQQPPVLA
jgi:hypothetical protein